MKKGDTAALEFNPDAKPHIKRNYWLNNLDGASWECAMAFVAMDTILPPILKDLGATNMLIAFAPQFMFLGIIATPILTAHRVEHRSRMKPMVLFFGVFQRLPYLAAAIGLYFFGTDHPKIAIACIIAAPLLSGMFGGLGFGAWTKMISKIIPPNRRASSFAFRLGIGSAIGLIAGLGVRHILEHYPNPTGYAALHLIAFVFMLNCVIMILFVKEVPDPHSDKHDSNDFFKNLKLIPALLKSDRRLRSFILYDMLKPAFLIALPFAAIVAMEDLDKGSAFAGTIVTVKMSGMLLGSIISGWIGDRFGGKTLGKLCLFTFILFLICLMIGGNEFIYLTAFFCFGIGITMDFISDMTLKTELAPRHQFATFVSLSLLLKGCCVLLYGLISGLLWNYALKLGIPGMYINGAACILLTLASFLILTTIPEPRKS